MKNISILFPIFILLILFSCSENNKVRINIVGYAKLEKFSIVLNDRSKIRIDGKSIKATVIDILPFESKVIYDKIRPVEFDSIYIKSNGEIIFNSYAGDQEYEGDFLMERYGSCIRIINTINMDDYFASVLGSEMGDGFSFEALKACAVAIRTYYYERRKEYAEAGYDINNADGIDMVYRGSSFATQKMYRAFMETEGLFLFDKKGKLALPLFHSTSGGVILKDEAMTSGFYDEIDDPVLTYDLDEKNIPLSASSPYFEFKSLLGVEDLQKIISGKAGRADIKDIKLKYFDKTGCVDFIGFVKEPGNIEWMKAYEFVSLCQKNGYHDVRSIQFIVEKIVDGYLFKGYGFGHLCGMSQYSAETLAEMEFSFDKILGKYYPDCVVRKTGYSMTDILFDG